MTINPKKKYVVRCGNYNGHSNVLFQMKGDDFRIDTENWAVVGEAIPAGRGCVECDGITYQRFSDWSLKKVC